MGLLGFWAHDLDDEAAATKALIDHFTARRDSFPGMHVYHYSHAERTLLEGMTFEHGVAELGLQRLIENGVFIDIFPIVSGAILLGEESYGLKHIDLLTDFALGYDVDKGAGAVVEWEHWMGEATLRGVASRSSTRSTSSTRVPQALD